MAVKRKKKTGSDTGANTSPQCVPDLHKLMDATHDGICLLSIGRKILQGNRALAKMFGIKLEEMAGRYCFEVIHGTKKQVAGCPLEKMRRSLMRETTEFEQKGRWFEATADPVLDDAGELTGILHVMRDITRRKKAEYMLRESEKRCRSIVEHANDGFYIHDLKGIVLDCNENACRMLGCSREELVGAHLRTFDSPTEQQLMPERISILLKNGYLVFDGEHVRKDGSRVAVNVSARLVSREGDGIVQSFARDITERKKTEEALLDALAFNREIISSVGAGVIVYDRQFRYREWNRFMESITGMKMAEVLGKKAFDLFPHLKEQGVDKFLERALSGETVVSPDMHFRVPATGKSGWTRATYAPHKNAMGGIIGVIGLIRDNTRNKEAEEALRESEEKYRTLAESSPEMIYLIDGQGFVRYVNHTGLGMFRGGSEAVIGKHLRDLYSPAVAERHLKAVRGVIKSGEMFLTELVEEFPTGKRWIDARLSPVKDLDGTITGVLGLSTDISERKKAENALAESEEKFRAIIEQNSEGIILIDEKCFVIEWNPAMERMTGISAPKAKGRQIWEVLGMTALPERWTELRAEQMKKMFLEAVKDGWSPIFGAPIEAVIVRNGEQVNIQQTIFPIKTEKGFRLGSITRDVTESKKLEERMARDEKLESLQVFAGGIAHDFNNLLAGIFGNIDLARVELPDDNPAQRYLNNSFLAFGRAKHLAQQLLTFAKGGIPQKRPRLLPELLTNASALALSGSNVKAEYRFASGLWPVEVDENQVSQVFGNLIINAWQAMPQGGTITIAAENRTIEQGTAAALSAGNYVAVTVEDRGTGIPATIIEKIFDPFFTTKQQGSGLGLATSYSIISRHGGSIEVQSEPGKGTVFTILLPATEKAVPEDDGGAPSSDLRGNGRILVMDDEGLIRRIVYDMLSMAGYEVTTAPEGREAVHKYREAFDIGKRFDAVILDLTVPGGMGGREAMKEILKIDAGALAIVSSGYSDDAVMADFTEFGFSARVPKPYSIKELLTTVKRVLEGRKK